MRPLSIAHARKSQLKSAQQHNYTALVVASAFSNLADGLLIVAMPWFASELTRDPVLIGLVTAATRLPWLLVSIPAGVLGDRVARVPLLLRADTTRAVLTLVLAFFVFVKGGSAPDSALSVIAALSLLAFALGAAEVVRDNTAQTVLPDIVPAAELERANGRLWSVELTCGQLIAPPVAGLLIAASLVSPFVASTIAYALAALALSRIRPPATHPSEDQTWREAIAEGWRWLWAHTELRKLALLLGMINLSATVVLTLLVLYSRELMLLGPTGYGLLLGAAALGGIVGGLLCPRIVARIGPLPSVWIAFVFFALCPLALWLNHSPVLAGCILFVEMFAAMLWNVVTVSWRQRVIPAHLLGRVNSLYRCAGWGFMTVGAVVGGIVVVLLEPVVGRDAALRAPYALAGLFDFALMVWAARWLRLA